MPSDPRRAESRAVDGYLASMESLLAALSSRLLSRDQLARLGRVVVVAEELARRSVPERPIFVRVDRIRGQKPGSLHALRCAGPGDCSCVSVVLR